MSRSLPRQARVVVIGGGIGGCSVAYHLTKLGWTEVVLLERKQLTCGTTWHAPGLVGTLWPTPNMTRLGKYSAKLYLSLEEETGQTTGYRQNGSISIATNKERMEELKRSASMARTLGVEVEVLGPRGLEELYRGLNVEDVVGGLYLPKDGQTNPVDTCMALAKGARMRGAQIFEETKVTGITASDGRVTGVETERGSISAEYVVNCGGIWAREMGRLAGVSVPLYACEHFYVVTEVIPGLARNLPILRDQDGCAYFKEDAGRLLVGGFEHNAKPLSMDQVPEHFCFDELPEDIEHFQPLLEGAMRRFPTLQSVGIRTFFNGPESFAPDNRYLMGEAPELRNFFVACGFSSKGIGAGGGIGKAIAEWIVHGHPPMDLWDSDIRRMMPFQNSQAYLRERVAEVLGHTYDMHWPYHQYETGRGMRKTPLYERLKRQGACFGEVAGWERPNWFAPDGVEARYRYSYRRQNWFPYAAEEHKAVRERVGLFDLSSLAKFLVKGPDAETVLQRICANNVAVPCGRVIYTQWMNEDGGIEADLTVTRLARDTYLIATSPGSQVRDFNWLTRHIPEGARAVAADIGSSLAVISVMGPESRALLSRLTDADLSNDAFPFGTAQEIELVYAKVRAQRISYVGELGWELYIPAELATAIFDSLIAEGAEFGLRLSGMHALDTLRIEKGFRHWGHDITDEDTPIEAGLEFACCFEKDIHFIGRDALLRQKEEGVTKRLVQFALDDPEPLLYQNEPIYRDGVIVGFLTSGNYGHWLGRAIGLGYVTDPGGVDADYVNSGKYEIEVACERYPATAGLRPFYDPKNERMRA